MDKIQQFLTVAAAVMSLSAGLLTFLIKAVKNGKAKKFLQQTLEITKVLQPLIIKAEQYVHYTGMEKKQFVMTEVQRYAIDHNLKLETDKMSVLIDEIVTTTKKVNAREKDVIQERIKRNEQVSI